MEPWRKAPITNTLPEKTLRPRTAVSEVECDAPPSPEMRGKISAMADRIQTVLGPMPNVSIVIADDMTSFSNHLALAEARGDDLEEFATSKPVLPYFELAREEREDTAGFTMLTSPGGHAIIALHRPRALAICDPDSEEHIAGVATLAHEMGHVRALQAGYDLRGQEYASAEEAMHGAAVRRSVSEYLAIRAEVETVDALFDADFSHCRAAPAAKAYAGDIERLKVFKQEASEVVRKKDVSLYRRMGYHAGTANGYLDGFRASQASECLPKRPHELADMAPEAAKVLNQTRGSLAALHDGILTGKPPDALLRQAAIDHRRAIEGVPAQQVKEQAPKAKAAEVARD